MILWASLLGDVQHPLVADLPCSVLQYTNNTLIVVKADAS
jgi:hypothetical protein